MKITPLALVLSTLAAVSGIGQTSSDTNATNAANATRTVPGASARDGFTLRGTEVVMTQKGVTTKVERDIVLPNGMRVLANGNIISRDGGSTALRPNQLLTFDGTFQDVALTPQGVAPLSSVDPGAPARTEAGVAARDGIFISGAEVFLTRNGVTEKVASDIRLPNGVTVKPNGTVVMSNGNTITLRPTQVLDLNGVLRDAPARPSSR